MDEATAYTDLGEEVAGGRLLGMTETNINNWESLNVHGRRRSDPLIISILNPIIIIFKESANSSKKVDLILSQSYMCSLGSDSIKWETLRGRLKRERIAPILFGFKVDLLRDDVGYEDLVFEPVNDIVFTRAAILFTFAPFDLKRKLWILSRLNLGFIEPHWTIEIPGALGIPFGKPFRIGKILLGGASFNTKILSILHEADLDVFSYFVVVFNRLSIIVINIINMNVDADIEFLKIDFTDVGGVFVALFASNFVLSRVLDNVSRLFHIKEMD